jgi:hypothetical protein
MPVSLQPRVGPKLDLSETKRAQRAGSACL